MGDAYPCANCGTESTDLFASVPVCKACLSLAERRLQKLDTELSRLRTVAVERIRLDLLETRLRDR